MAPTDQARESGFKRVFLPVENVNEASVIGGMELYGIRDLRHLLEAFGKASYAGGVNDKYGRIAEFHEPLRGGFFRTFRLLLRRAAEVAGSWKT